MKKLSRIFFILIAAAVAVAASVSMSAMYAVFDVEISTVADADTESRYDNFDDFNFDFIQTSGVPQLSSVSWTSSAVSGLTFRPSVVVQSVECTAWLALLRAHLFPFLRRHTLYYVFALHHMRN